MTEEKRNQLFKQHVQLFFPDLESLYEVCKSVSAYNKADLSGATKMIDSYLFEYEGGKVKAFLQNLGYDVVNNNPTVLWNLYRFKLSHSILEVLDEFVESKAS